MLMCLSIEISCGGTRRSTRESETCNVKATEILEGDTVCDPDQIESFEMEIKNWQATCDANAQPLTKNLINQRLASSIKCSEETALFNNQRNRCQKRVEELEGQETCVKEACDDLLASIKNVIAECQNLIGGSTALDNARRLQADIEQKVKEEVFETEIVTLAANCDKSKQLTKEEKTDDALAALVLSLANPLIQRQIEKGEPEDQAAADAFSLCKEVLKETIDAHVRTISHNLNKGAIKKDPKRWMSLFRNLEGTLARLQEVGVPNLLPGATDELQQLLLSLDKQRNIQESKTIDKNALAVKKALTGGVSKCRQLKANLERYKAKIAEHTERGNENKVKAYTKQKERAEQALDDFAKNIKKNIDSNSLPKKEMAALIKDLEEAGCLTPAPAE